VLPAQRTARAWGLQETGDQQTVQALADEVDGVFGKLPAWAYERALLEISMRKLG